MVPILVLVLFLDLCVESGFSQSTPARDDHVHHHSGGCSHSHDHDHDNDHHHVKKKTAAKVEMKLPEELAEEEDMRLCGFGPCLHDHDHESSSTLTGFGKFGSFCYILQWVLQISEGVENLEIIYLFWW